MDRVGVGEAALSPAAYSMIADYFSREQRATAISVYSMGIYVRSGLAFLISGQVVKFAEVHGPLLLPLLGEGEAPLALSVRDRLQEHYCEAVARLTGAYQRDGDHESSVGLFRQGLSMDELHKDSYQGLMHGYLALNRPR